METETENNTKDARSSAAHGSETLWLVGVVLSKRTPTATTFTQSLSYRYGCTENEARGEAVKFAMEKRPDFSVDIITAVAVAGAGECP